MARGWTGRAGALGTAATVAGLALGLGAAPAAAAQPQVEIARPLAQGVLDTTTVEVRGTATQPNGRIVNDIVYRVWGDPAADPVLVLRRQVVQSSSRIDFTAALALGRNGEWTIAVTATGQDEPVDIAGPEDGTATVEHVLVEAPPGAPTGLRLALAPSAKEATVSWEANREPDLLGYEVERQNSEGIWEPVATVEAGAPTTAADESPTRNQAGEYAYRVIAARPGATATRPLMRSGPAAVSLNPATGTTSTTTPPPAEAGSGPATGTGAASGGSPGPGESPTTSTGGGSALSALDRLLLARRQTTATTRPLPPDPGFQSTLPFAPGSPAGDDVAIEEDGPQEQAAGERSTISEDGPNQTRSLAFFAGGLLATVLLMHSLWIRDEVARAEALDPLPAGTVDDGPAGCAPGVEPDR